MATNIQPLAVPDDLHQEVRQAASETHLPVADVLRQSIKLGLPKLRQRHAPDGKLFNLAPWDAKKLARAYRNKKVDTDYSGEASIRGQALPRD